MSSSNAANRKRKSSATLSQMAETEREHGPNIAAAASAASQPEDSEATIPCPRCLHDVPLSNRRLHEINCARRVRAGEEFFGQTAGSDNGAPTEEQTAVLSQFPFPRSRPPMQPSSITDSSHHNSAIAQSLADVMVDDARHESVEVRPRDGQQQQQQQQPYGLSYQDVPARTNNPPITMHSASASSQTNNSGPQTEWACPRCTLLNPRSATHCDACLFQRHINSTTSTVNSNASTINNNTTAAMSITAPRPPDPIRSSRLIGDPFVSDLLNNTDDGWVNITNRDALRRITNNEYNNNGSTSNRLTTGVRIFNSALNGAMIGSVFGGVGGMIFGAISGGLGGAYISSRQTAEEAEGTDEVEAVIREAYQNGAAGNGVRVRRGRNHLIAVSTENGSRRVLRLRRNGDTRAQAGDAATELALSELLLRMSHMHGLGGDGNVVIQPNMSYEELLERFGMGDENRRGASDEVIDSYPVAIVGDDAKHDAKLKDDHDGKDNQSSADEKTVDYGTCGICLEDYAKGDSKKCLSCPHSFHKECIDRWLKRVASCPICKKEVEMYQPEKVERKPPSVTIS